MEFSLGFNLHAQRALHVDQDAIVVQYREFAQPRPPARQRRADLFAPGASTGRIGGQDVAGVDRQPVGGLRARQRRVGLRQRCTDARVEQPVDRPHREVHAAGTQRRCGCERGVDRSGGFGRDAGHRQAQREVAAVQAPGQRAGDAFDIGLQHVGHGAQDAIGGFSPQPVVGALQFQQAHQDQCRSDRATGLRRRTGAAGAQLVLQPGQEMRAQQQAGDGIVLRLPLQQRHLSGLGVEDGAQAPHGGIHAAGELAQFGQPRLLGLDEATLLQRLRLCHRGAQGSPPQAQQPGRRAARGERQQRQQQGRTLDRIPQRIARPGGVRLDLQLADLAPAIADDGHARGRRDRPRPRKPRRRVPGARSGLQVDERPAVDGLQAQAAVVTQVELRRGHDLQRRGVAVLLRQGQRQR